MDELFEQILQKLKKRIPEVDSQKEWLFIAVNTMKAIVGNFI